MENLSRENEFYLHVNENSFSYERLSPRLALKKRYKTIQEWPSHCIVSLYQRLQCHFAAGAFIGTLQYANLSLLIR